jgi:hypothetical protein
VAKAASIQWLLDEFCDLVIEGSARPMIASLAGWVTLLWLCGQASSECRGRLSKGREFKILRKGTTLDHVRDLAMEWAVIGLRLKRIAFFYSLYVALFLDTSVNSTSVNSFGC